MPPRDKLGPSPPALMDLKPGDRLGDRYQLLSKLGSGGMGEVWKARDTELDRDVALKVSKAEFTARFRQEARAMAASPSSEPCLATLSEQPQVLRMTLQTPEKGQFGAAFRWVSGT